MTSQQHHPRILIVTPEVTYFPAGMDNACQLAAKAGGLADVSAALISALFEEGADVHVAMPDYRSIFDTRIATLLQNQRAMIRKKLPNDRVHLAEDRAFYYLNRVYSDYGLENIKIALAFQREVINNIIPRVDPDLIHCNDWMTGLIPAAARNFGIPSLFTLHNIHTVKTTIAEIEDRGIDAASFWNYLFFINIPLNYWEARDTNPVDLLCSGVFSSHFVNTVSYTFLTEIAKGQHSFIEHPLQQEIANKLNANCATGILNAPDPSFHPSKDPALSLQYDSTSFSEGKIHNKLHLQEMLGLISNCDAPILFWPSRLDPIQKGCQLLSDIIYHVVSMYWENQLEIIFIANGAYQNIFKDIVNFHQLHNRIAVCDFSSQMERLAYGASDFLMMPSRFEPCGLPQMIGAIYGCLPIVHNTGGLHDTVTHINVDKNSGNGFVFDVFDANGLFWAIREAMAFYTLPNTIKNDQISRIMKQSEKQFTHSVTARHYIDLYEKMLERPLI